MDQFETLKTAGIDMDGLLKRLMGNQTLVRLFVKKFTEDGNIEKLQDAFAARDMGAAEMASHTLKGMCGNLSLEELFQLFSRQVVLLRSEDFAAAEAMMPQILGSYRHTISHMKAFLGE